MCQVHAGAGEHLAASGPALPRPRPRHARPALAERGLPREAGAQGGGRGRGRVHHGRGQRPEERQEPRQQGHQLTHRGCSVNQILTFVNIFSSIFFIVIPMFHEHF